MTSACACHHCFRLPSQEHLAPNEVQFSMRHAEPPPVPHKHLFSLSQSPELSACCFQISWEYCTLITAYMASSGSHFFTSVYPKICQSIESVHDNPTWNNPRWESLRAPLSKFCLLHSASGPDLVESSSSTSMLLSLMRIDDPFRDRRSNFWTR